MINNVLSELFERDLNKLKNEIGSYKTEENLWFVEDGISNSAGNLCLHLLGNLNHFIGATLGSTGYVRNREQEFSLKNIPAEQLISNIESLLPVIKSTLQKLSVSDLESEFPVRVFDRPYSTEMMLMHLSTHLTYHLGQINYHRRLLD